MKNAKTSFRNQIMCVERLSRGWIGMQLSSFIEPDVGSRNDRLPRVPDWAERQDFPCSDGLWPMATNLSVWSWAPRKNRRRRTGQGTRAEAARQTSTRVKPLHVQAVGVQSRILSTAQVVIFKPLNCNECGVSGAKERGLSSETHVLCITCAAVRYRLELE